MFIRSIILCVLLIAMAVGVLLALLLPAWLLALILASLIVIYGLGMLMKW